ncbi:hypothetical protein [Rhizobium etli]|nr:hypothetical protein [Rhizobium etli]
MFKEYDWNNALGSNLGQANKLGQWYDRSFASSVYILPPETDFGPYRLLESDVQYVILSGTGGLYLFDNGSFAGGEFYQPDPTSKVLPTPKPSGIYERAVERVALQPVKALAVKKNVFHALRAEGAELSILVTHSSLSLQSQFVAR